jgi:23S rRNA (uracil1939-C5)-methyltransferase
MDACETLIPEFSALLPSLKILISSLRQPDRIPQIEIAAGDSDHALILRHLDPLDASDRQRLQAFAKQHRVAVFLQSGGYDTIEALSVDQSPYLGYANVDFGLYYHFLPWDFTQVNLLMNRYLVLAALSAFGTPAAGRLFDLFCGIGNFSLAAARLGWDVVGFEAAAESVARAQGNAGLNGLASRCEFRVADLYDPGCDLSGACDYLLLDPPRSGAGPNLARWIETLQPSKLVYVSCQPGTFATDAAILQRSGYQLDQVGIFDMFPNTAHVETLGSFSRQW